MDGSLGRKQEITDSLGGYSNPGLRELTERTHSAQGTSRNIQSTLAISTSVISNNRLFRSEILVPALT